MRSKSRVSNKQLNTVATLCVFQFDTMPKFDEFYGRKNCQIKLSRLVLFVVCVI